MNNFLNYSVNFYIKKLLYIKIQAVSCMYVTFYNTNVIGFIFVVK